MITLYRYDLTFKKPFIAGGEKQTKRKGVIIRYKDQQLDIASEVAPLPGFSKMTLDVLVPALVSGIDELQDFTAAVSRPDEIQTFLHQKQYPPSAQFGISCMALHIIAFRNPAALDTPPFTHPTERLNVNAVIGKLGGQETLQGIDHLYKKGFRTIKLKCGTSPQDLPGIIQRATRSFPELVFRIDPNRSWPIDKTIGYLEKFRNLPVEYCEEPCYFERLEDFAELKKQSDVPLALDESIANLEMLDEVLSTHAADTVIIKPMLFGNILDLLETCFREETHSINKVCTTSLESGVGRYSITHLTSLIGSPHAAHGLDTGRLMRDDLYEEGKICHGTINTVEYGHWCVPFLNCRKKNLFKIE